MTRGRVRRPRGVADARAADDRATRAGRESRSGALFAHNGRTRDRIYTRLWKRPPRTRARVRTLSDMRAAALPAHGHDGIRACLYAREKYISCARACKLRSYGTFWDRLHFLRLVYPRRVFLDGFFPVPILRGE